MGSPLLALIIQLLKPSVHPQKQILKSKCKEIIYIWWQIYTHKYINAWWQLLDNRHVQGILKLANSLELSFIKAAIGNKMNFFASAPAPVKLLACWNDPNKTATDNKRLKDSEWLASVEQLTLGILPCAESLRAWVKPENLCRYWWVRRLPLESWTL